MTSSQSYNGVSKTGLVSVTWVNLISYYSLHACPHKPGPITEYKNTRNDFKKVSYVFNTKGKLYQIRMVLAKDR